MEGSTVAFFATAAAVRKIYRVECFKVDAIFFVSKN
jgi:hypothetical protein